MKVKIGDAEFEATGPDQTAISDAYRTWLKYLHEAARQECVAKIETLSAELRVHRAHLKRLDATPPVEQSPAGPH